MNIYWNRNKDAQGIYTYRIYDDEKVVYMEQIDSAQSFFAFQKQHAKFLDTVAYYRSHGKLPTRSQRGVLKKR